jgi:6-phosphogluconolactonase
MKFFKNFFIFLAFTQADPSFLINAASEGSFQPVPGSPFATGVEPFTIIYSPIASGNLFAAIPNFVSNTVSVYKVNQTTGAFTLVNTPSTGSHPSDAVYSPIASGNLFAAVADFSSNNIEVYTVNQTSGVWTSIGTFATGSGPEAIAYSPIASGNLFAAAANANDNTVSVYSVNQTTGAFTPVAGSPFATGTGPTWVAFSPIASGNLFAAVANFDDNTVSVYSVNQTTGAFTPVAGSPFATGTHPLEIAYSPVASGNLFAAIANGVDNTVSVYAVNQTTGAFTPVAGSPFATGAGPVGIAFSPVVSGDLFAAVPNNTDNTVSVYLVNQSTGIFTQISGSPFATGSGPGAIDYSPIVLGNLFAAVPNFNDNTVSVYEVFVLHPPISIAACNAKNIFLTQKDTVNIIAWSAPTKGPIPTQYFIYRDAALTDLAGTVAGNSCLKFFDHNRRNNVVYTYYVVSADQFGNVSQPISVTVNQECAFSCGSCSSSCC